MQSSGLWSWAAEMIKELEEWLVLHNGKLRQVVDVTVEMHASLASEGGSKLKMLISYVDNLPTGDEIRLFYALDLEGTNFRVFHVQLGGKEKCVVNQEFEEVSIPPHLMVGGSDEPFDFMALSLQNLLLLKGMIFTVLLIGRGSLDLPSLFQRDKLQLHHTL